MKKVSNKNIEKFTVPFDQKIDFSHTVNAKNLKSRVKTAKHRKLSSTVWLQRHINDIYVKKAKIEGYLSRAAYKLLEVNQKFNLIKPNDKVVDLGAAPGGWSQVASKLVGKKGLVIAIDLLEIKVNATNTIIIQNDFLSPITITSIQNALGGKANVILSDMSPNTTGSRELDHLKILHLIETVLEFAHQTLAVGGSLVIKVFKGGLEQNLVNSMKQKFQQVKYFKPKSSRQESKEIYLIAKNLLPIEDDIF